MEAEATFSRSVLACEMAPLFTRQLIPRKFNLCSQGIARVATLLPGTSFLPINGTRNAVVGLLFFGQLILMQNLFNIGK